MTSKIFSYNYKDLHEFRYGIKKSDYFNKNLSICSYDKYEENQFYNTEFNYCDFSVCTLEDFSLIKTKYNNCDFFRSNFINMNIHNSVFYRSELTKSTFNNCDFKNSKFIICRGLTKNQIEYIESRGGKIINRIVKIKSKEEYWPTIEMLRETLSSEEFGRTSIILVIPITTRIKNKLVSIKNKIFYFLDKINKASLAKTKRRIQNMYKYQLNLGNSS